MAPLHWGLLTGVKGSDDLMDIANMPQAPGQPIVPAHQSEHAEHAEHAAHAAHVARRERRRYRMSVSAQYARFCMVGFSNAVVDLATLNLLLWARPTRNDGDLLLYNTIAVALGILNSYLWNTRWTFRSGVTHTSRQKALFMGQAILNIIINNAVLLILTDTLPTPTGEWSRLTANIAKLVGMAAASSFSFILLRAFIFRPQSSQS